MTAARPPTTPEIAGKAASLGMEVAAMSPDRFADWLAEAMS